MKSKPATKTNKPKVKVRDLKPKKDARGGLTQRKAGGKQVEY